MANRVDADRGACESKRPRPPETTDRFSFRLAPTASLASCRRKARGPQGLPRAGPLSQSEASCPISIEYASCTCRELDASTRAACEPLRISSVPASVLAISRLRSVSSRATVTARAATGRVTNHFQHQFEKSTAKRKPFSQSHRALDPLIADSVTRFGPKTSSRARSTRSSARRTITRPNSTSCSTASIQSPPTPSPRSPAKTRSGCGSTGRCETGKRQFVTLLSGAG